MPPPRSPRVQVLHPYAWLWEPLQDDPTFVLRTMFGAKAAYLGGKLMLCFVARGKEPWHGVLVATERDQHPALVNDFAALRPHPILPKWLYLPDSARNFEAVAERLVALARRRDPRLGIIPPASRRKPRRTTRPR